LHAGEVLNAWLTSPVPRDRIGERSDPLLGESGQLAWRPVSLELPQRSSCRAALPDALKYFDCN
jgi:hypothetical protein